MPESELPTFLDAFKENPGLFAGVLAFGSAGLLALLVAVASLIRKGTAAKIAGFVALGFGVLTLVLGGVSSFYARAAVDQVLQMPGLTDSDKDRLRAHGYAEASYPFYLAIGLGLLPFLGGFGSLVASRSRSKG